MPERSAPRAVGRVGIGIWNQQPFIERRHGQWRLWVSFNSDVTSGTYFDLFDNGVMDVVTIKNDHVMEVRRVNTK